MSKTANKFFSEEQEEDITLAIKTAELDTSGEIRVHIESDCKGDVMDRASHLFQVLDMDETKQRNGVLIYLAVESRKFAIIGDAGINEKVGHNFWDSIKQRMCNYFREGQFVDGLIDAITQTGLRLKQYFPYLRSDGNELPDDISFA